MSKEAAVIALKKIALGASEFPNMKDYVKHLMSKFDLDSDGLITFNELCEGMHHLNISLTPKDKQALMKKLDINRDGDISSEELFKVLSQVDTKFSAAQINYSIEHVLRKIAIGSEDFTSMREYVKVLFTLFDLNSDGMITFEELCTGLKHFNVNLS